MRELLERSFFPYVVKPGRYAGGEPGHIRKDPQGKILYLHACPVRYEIGQQRLNDQSLYHIINAKKNLVCERLFAVDRDAEAIMREKNIPIFSLESSRQVRDFDAIGFSLSSPLEYTNVLAIIDLAGMPLMAANRTDESPLIIGLGEATMFPEPMAPFFDIFLIGDAEEDLPKLLESLHLIGKKPRPDLLKYLLNEFSSLYIPSFYDSNRSPLSDLVDIAPKEIKAQSVSQLKPEFYPPNPLVPLIDTMGRNLKIEISRSLSWLGDFRNGDSDAPAPRHRSAENIKEQVLQQLKTTGNDEVTLVNSMGTSKQNIASLASSLSSKFAPERVSILIKELVPGQVTPALIDGLSKVKRSRLTINSGAASERLRLLLGLKFPDSALLDSVRIIFSKGWNSIQLRFFIGLPSESDDDIRAIILLARAVHKIGIEFGGKKTIILELLSFSPIPHTPFQWDAVEKIEELQRRIKLIRQGLKYGNIQIKHPDLEISLFSKVLMRGRREMASTILTAFKKGCRHDIHAEEMKFELWRDAFTEHKIEFDSYLKAIPFSHKLPWSHITTKVPTSQLMHERQKSSISVSDLSPEITDVVKKNTQQVTSSGFGRSKKKLATRAQTAPTKNRVRLRWGKTTQFRFMSHLDNLRLLERLIRRASLPVAYSQGQTPTMKLSLGPPLPLGFTSEAEHLDVTLMNNLSVDMIVRFKDILPDGISIFDAKSVLGSRKSLSAAINRVIYTLPISYWSDTTLLQEQVESLLERQTILYERETKNGLKTIDIRAGVYDLKLIDTKLHMTLGIGDGGIVRPTELLTSMSKSLTWDIPALPFHRLKLYREEENGSLTNPMDI